VVLTQDWHPPGHISFASAHPGGASPGDIRRFQYAPDGAGKLCRQPGLPGHLAQHAVECGGGGGGSAQAAGAAGDPAGGCHSVTQQLWPDHCLQGTEAAALDPGLLTWPDDVAVHKGWEPHIDAYSAFFDNGRLQQTRLDGLLRRQGRGTGPGSIARLVVAGLALDFCVKWTALDAVELGYEVLLVLEATAAVDGPAAGAVARELEEGGVRLVGTVDEAVQLLAGLAAGRGRERPVALGAAAARPAAAAPSQCAQGPAVEGLAGTGRCRASPG
jgi:nicotinamidase/pyrazinamidase